jgi:hypothetical protein
VLQTREPWEQSVQTTINGHPGWIVGFDSDLPWPEVVAFYENQAAGLGMVRTSFSDHEAEPGDQVSIASWEDAGYHFRVDHARFAARRYLLPGYLEPGYNGFTVMLEATGAELPAT